MESPFARLAGLLLSARPSRGLVLGVWAWGAVGCLLPQDDTYLEGIPERKNRPPRIVESQVQPSERIIRNFGAGLCELEFGVAVEDPDVDDTLSVRWYFDYDAENPTGPYRELPLLNNGQAQRGDRGTLRINLAAANSPLAAPGIHLVEALVTDTRLVDREPQPVSVTPLADGGYIVNPGYATTYAWFIETVAGGDCP